MFFNLFKKKKYIKMKLPKYVCKHCKYTCKNCDMLFCFSCHMNEANPCPKCGKRNIDYQKNNS